jgi:hypothetical protein
MLYKFQRVDLISLDYPYLNSMKQKYFFVLAQISLGHYFSFYLVLFV